MFGLVLVLSIICVLVYRVLKNLGEFIGKLCVVGSVIRYMLFWLML